MKTEQEILYKLDITNKDIADMIEESKNGGYFNQDYYIIKNTERNVLNWILDKVVNKSKTE